jgi:hypothetical protein
MKMNVRTASLVALAAALGLGACSSKPADPGPLNTGVAANESDNETAEAPPPVADTPQVSEAQSKSEPVADPNALPASDGAGPSPQVIDDADAAGMTARLPDSGETAPAEK